ncbi:histidinol-phosphate transaminase [uncultured Porphyromonas sp.]|uniref:pyridoxal phosphate-dependent aminotransferase n=1 Tax=uncultured Porphyromonas sp. TaxID=159274 RepID=UPI00259463C2|nr:histidinol-phosphate transaminase [uncultured Porphyromonas sp.]
MLYEEDYPHGGDRYSRPIRLDFSVNTNPYGPLPEVVEAALSSRGELDHYPDPYCRELVRAIARKEQLPEEYILCGNGAAELIDLYVRALRPRTALEAAPTFSEYRRSLTAAGCEVRDVVLTRESGFVWEESVLDRLDKEQPDLLVLCNPNNPTGRLISPSLLDRILSLCDERGIAVLIDECFIDLADRRESRTSDLPRYSGLMILNAFTKSYSLAGLRLGYCMTTDSCLLTRMSRLSQPWNVSVPAQRAGVVAAGRSYFLIKSRAKIREQRAALSAGLKDLGLEVLPSEVNFLLFRGPVGLDKELERRGILIRNCANYHGLSDGWYRIAVRPEEENKVLLNTLSAILKCHG